MAMRRLSNLYWALTNPPQTPPLTAETAVENALGWILFSQDRATRFFAEGGYSRRYSLLKGWDHAYPETTGYIIPTLLNAAEIFPGRKDELVESARMAGEWLLSIQNQDGSFNDIDEGRRQIFDTGQIIFGFNALHKATGESRYQEAISRAASWIVEVQEKDGSWSKFACHFYPHTYYSRVAWSLGIAHGLTGEEHYRKAAKKNLDWVLNQQRENGWFEDSGFVHAESLLHTIAYTLQGLIESSVSLKQGVYLEAACKTANVLLDLGKKNRLKSYYAPNWNCLEHSVCLTGLAQVSLVFKRIYQLIGGEEYFDMALNLDSATRSKQISAGGKTDIHGAIPGSHPLWGKYCPMSFPNWAPKFLIDTFLRTKEIQTNRNFALHEG
jgi:hypothetical protein